MRPDCVLAVSKAIGRDITAAESREIEQRINGAARNLALRDRDAWQRMSNPERLAAAAKAAGDDLNAAATRKRQMAAMAVKKQAELDAHVEARKAEGMSGLEAVERTLLENADLKSGFLPVETRIKSIANQYMAQLMDTWHATEPRLFGLLANRDATRLLVRELAGEDTGSALAKQGAKTMLDTFEAMRQRFNAAGGEIRKRDNYRSPQSHNQALVARFGGRDGKPWVDYVMPRVDRSQYVTPEGHFLNDVQMREFLHKAYETIASGGMNKIDPNTGFAPGKNRVIANRNNEARQIHFKDANSFLEYNSQFGARSFVTSIASTVQALARDIAMVETYGPNPDATLGMITRREAIAQTKANGEERGAAVKQANYIESVFNFMAGRREQIAGKWLARISQNVRDVMIAARLGSSPITALVDEGTLHLSARVMGLNHLQLLRNELAAYSPFNQAEKALLARAGLGIDHFTSELNRWGEETLDNGISRRLAETNIKLSGLDRLDSARMRSLGATMFDAFGKLSRERKTMADLDPEDLRVVQGKGLTEQDWQVWRAADTDALGPNNPNAITPESIMRIPNAKLAELTGGNASKAQAMRYEAATKLLGFALQEGHMAVPMPGVAQRLTLGAGGQRGTVGNELVRSIALFKSFPFAMIQKHFVQRGLRGQATPMGSAAYVASLVASTTILGAIAQSISNISSGKDPQRYWGDNTARGEILKNWTQAFLKGGSLGLYGDFLFSPLTHGGQTDLLGTLGGPVLGNVQSLLNIVEGPLAREATGLQPGQTTGAKAVKFVQGLTPGASLWYAKAALDHLVFQNIEEMMSPGYLGRMQARAERDFNERYWWAPRQDVQQARAPNIARAVGGTP